MLRFILVVCLMFVVTVQVFAQSSKQDVVHLKNGSVIRGTITELIPGQLQIKIKTQDGNIFVYHIEDLARVSLERRRPSIYQQRDPWIAFGLSAICPGGGQVYNKHYGKAVILFTSTIIGVILLRRNTESDLIGGTKEDYQGIYDDLVDIGPDDVGLILGGILGIGGYVYSVIDAPKSANKINRQGGIAYGHLLEFDSDRTTLGIDPIVSRKTFGTMLTLHW